MLCAADALKNLVGEDNARHGTIKVFEALQDVRLNKHIFYVRVGQSRETSSPVSVECIYCLDVEDP